jgi:fumarate reductase subunit D
MYAKAIAAFITPLIVTLLMPLGIDETSTVTQLVEAVIMAVSTALMVFFVPNKVK